MSSVIGTLLSFFCLARVSPVFHAVRFLPEAAPKVNPKRVITPRSPKAEPGFTGIEGPPIK